MAEMKSETVNTAIVDVEEQLRKDNENAAAIDFKMVTFSLAEKDYSIDIMHVKEIAKASRFTYVPNTLPFVLGVYNLRGEIIPILDLRLFFNIEVGARDPNRLENMLILQVEDQKFGVVVDKIDKVVGVQKSSIQPPHPLFGDINIKYIEGIVESNKRLYVLLDITKIFTSKETLELNEQKKALQSPVMPMQNTVRAIPGAVSSPVNSNTGSLKTASVQGGLKSLAQGFNSLEEKSLTGKSVSSNSSVKTESDAGGGLDENALKFVKDNLLNYMKFTVSSVNDTWITRRCREVAASKGGAQVVIQNQAEAEEFLKPFWSECSGNWWTKEYADAVMNLLPDNSAKQIIVWNPGCSKGMETYSLACVLNKRYPNAKVRIYAQDIDLLAVTNATMLTIPKELVSDWYGPYLTKKANGDYTFIQDIKDSIMFEYHDCKNTNALPMVDIIFARDILSVLDEKSQNAVVSDFLEKMKGNAIVVIGDNEAMPDSFNFGEKTVGELVAYSKD